MIRFTDFTDREHGFQDCATGSTGAANNQSTHILRGTNARQNMNTVSNARMRKPGSVILCLNRNYP